MHNKTQRQSSKWSIESGCAARTSESPGSDGSYVETCVLLSRHSTPNHHAVALGRSGGHVDVVAHAGRCHTGAVTAIARRTPAPTLMLRSPHAACAYPAITRPHFTLHVTAPASLHLAVTVSGTTPCLATSSNLCNKTHLLMSLSYTGYAGAQKSTDCSSVLNINIKHQANTLPLQDRLPHRIKTYYPCLVVKSIQ